MRYGLPANDDSPSPSPARGGGTPSPARAYLAEAMSPRAGLQLRKLPDAPWRGSDPDKSPRLVERFFPRLDAELADLDALGWSGRLGRRGAGMTKEQFLHSARAARDRLVTAARAPPVSEGRGAYGTVLVFRKTAHVVAALNALRAEASAAPGGAFVQASPGYGDGNDLVAVKIQAVLTLKYFVPVRERLREDAIHAYLSTAGCRVGADGRKWCALDAVPQLFWSGLLPDANVSLTVMEGVRGEDLGEATARMPRERLREVYAAFERAVFTLWAFGVFHGDMHLGNAVLLPDGRVKVLDFGMSALLRDATTPPTLEELRSPRLHLAADAAADTVMRARGYTRYNPNTKALKDFWAQAAPTRANESTPENDELPAHSTYKSGHLARNAGNESRAAADALVAATVAAIRDARAGGGTLKRDVDVDTAGGSQYGRVLAAPGSRPGAWVVTAFMFSSREGTKRRVRFSGDATPGGAVRVTSTPTPDAAFTRAVLAAVGANGGSKNNTAPACPRACGATKLCNDLTRRCVLRDGRAGKEVLARRSGL